MSGRLRPASSSWAIAPRWLAQRTGGIAQTSLFDAHDNVPISTHVISGAVVGADASYGVIDPHLQLFGYQNLVVCDAAAMPANPGVNPALTITALAEPAMAQIPAAGSR
jgi:cholesterol oxidase